MALAADPLALRQIEEISEQADKTRRARLAAKSARHYIPRGSDTREAFADLLLHGAEVIAAARAAGLPSEQARSHAIATLCTLGTYAYWPNGTPSPGDPVRAAKHGDNHNLGRTLALGAAFIVRRGTRRCMNLKGDGANGFSHDEPCRTVLNSGNPYPYCSVCIADGPKWDHNRRLKIIETTLAHAPALAPPSVARDRRRHRMKA